MKVNKLYMGSKKSDEQASSEGTRIINPQLFVGLVVLSLLTTLVDLLGFNIYDGNTPSELIGPTLSLVIFGYIGFTLADFVMEKFLTY